MPPQAVKSGLEHLAQQPWPDAAGIRLRAQDPHDLTGRPEDPAFEAYLAFFKSAATGLAYEALATGLVVIQIPYDAADRFKNYGKSRLGEAYPGEFESDRDATLQEASNGQTLVRREKRKWIGRTLGAAVRDTVQVILGV